MPSILSEQRQRRVEMSCAGGATTAEDLHREAEAPRVGRRRVEGQFSSPTVGPTRAYGPQGVDVERIDLGGGEAEHLVHLLGRNAGERPPQRLTRVGVRRLRVRIVDPVHHVVDADLVAQRRLDASEERALT